MRSPETLAFEIFLGPKKKKNGNYRTPLVSIWHHDPEKDGTDDSCGWFMRSRHGDPEMLKKIRSAIDFEFSRTFKSENATYYTGFFSPKSGMPQMSVMGIGLNMFNLAAWEFFKHDRKKQKKWMRENLFDILHFSENPVDSLNSDITGMFRIGCGEEWKREEALNNYSSAIYGWILRSTRKWYQHPKWHIHHWELQFHPWQQFKRRYLQKCSKCGVRGFKSAAYSDWNGTKVWCQNCENNTRCKCPGPQ